MSQALRKLTGTISKSGTCLVFINQIRMKIGVMFGNPETTTGGKALKFYSSVRVEVRRIETITKGSDDAIGNRVRVKVVKNKVAPPFRKAEVEIMFGKGISASGSLLDAGIKYDVISKSGSWYSYGEERIGQGRENVKEFLEQNPQIATDIEEKSRRAMFPERYAASSESATETGPPEKSGPGKSAAEKSSGAAEGGAKKDSQSTRKKAPASESADGGGEDELF
jgi:recombination protein RecA